MMVRDEWCERVERMSVLNQAVRDAEDAIRAATPAEERISPENERRIRNQAYELWERVAVDEAHKARHAP